MPSAAFLEPISRSSPISIPGWGGGGGSSVCATSPGASSSSLWGSTSSAPFGGLSGSSLMRFNCEEKCLSSSFYVRREGISMSAVAEAEETSSFVYIGSPALSNPFAVGESMQRRAYCDAETEYLEDESIITPSSFSANYFSPLASLDSPNVTGKLLSRKPPTPRRRTTVSTFEVDNAMREVDASLSYLGPAGKYRVKKAIALVLENCHMAEEISWCTNMVSILAELEMDEVTLQAGALNRSDFSRTCLSCVVDGEVIRLLEAHRDLQRKTLGSQAPGSLSAKEHIETQKELSDIRLVALELTSAVVSWRLQSAWGALGIEIESCALADLTLRFYTPIAHIYGFAVLQRELEEKAFEENCPREYRRLKCEVLAKTSRFVNALDSSGKKLEKLLLSDPDFRSKVSSVHITGRQKSLYSIFRKMQRKHLRLDEIFDMLALRVVITPRLDLTKPRDTVEQTACYNAMQIVKSRFGGSSAQRVKDYIAKPKSNGYQSLHMTVHIDSCDVSLPLEIQIRTDRMHRVAEIGTAAHVQYKGVAEVDTASQVRSCSNVDKAALKR